MQENQQLYGSENYNFNPSGPKKKFQFKLPSKKVSFLVIFIVLILGSLGLLLNEYLKPVYTIGKVSISREDINQYAKAIDDYKNGDDKLDFGGDSKQVARDDLVLNAAFINEMDKRGIDYYVEARTKLKEKLQAEEYSPEVSKMLMIRQENEYYKRQMGSKLLSIKDFTVVSIPLDSPLFLNKSPDEVKELREQAVDRLNTDFLPDLKEGKKKEELAAKADVVVFDKDDTDNNNWQQYEEKNVVTLDYRTGYVAGASVFNDKDITSYYDVEVPNIVKTDEKISTLGKIGDTTDVFASKSGSYMILRLDKASGGKYNNWNEMVKDYKLKSVSSKFAYLPTTTTSISAIQPKYIEKFSTFGLQKAQAAIPGGCNSHVVNFVISAIDDASFTKIAGMQGRFVRNAPSHSCGSQWLGTKSFSTPSGGSSTITDNCWGDQPQWYLDKSPTGYTITNLQTAEGFFATPYYGWPKWTSGHINSVGTIYIDGHFKKNAQAPTSKASGITSSTCDRIRGWIFDRSQTGYLMNVSLFFDVNPSSTGGLPVKKWDIGVANKYHEYVNLAYQTGSDNFGFDVNPTNYMGINIKDGKAHRVWAWASSRPGSPNQTFYQFASFTIPACSPPVPVGSRYEPASVIKFMNGTNSDSENPDSLVINYEARANPRAFATTGTPSYYIVRSGAPGVKEPIPSPSTTFDNPPPATIPITSAFQSSADYVISDPVTKLSLDVGDKVCASYSISPGAVTLNSSGGIASITQQTVNEADESCDTISNKPYIGFYGNDVKVGVGIEGSATCIDQGPVDAGIDTYSSGNLGSGAQIAAFAMGEITDFATAKKNTSQGSNELSVPNFGNYGPNCTHDYFNEAPATITGISNTQLNDFSSTKLKANGPQSIGPLNIPPKKNKYVYVEGDVVINDSITFTGTAGTIGELPSFYLVVKGDIFIQENVRQLDGVYVAQTKNIDGSGGGGNIYTCANGTTNTYADNVKASTCNKQLVVNGVFIGNKMHFDRTFGSLRDAANDIPFSGLRDCSNGNGKGDTCAAEVFNFNPSLFLANSPKPDIDSEEKAEQVPFSTSLPPLL